MHLIPKKTSYPGQTSYDGPVVRDTHLQWIETIAINGTGLTQWEEEFVESITEQLAVGRYLSEKQADILERIWREKA